jgi:cytochrome c-type biogenesis protein CcmH/NrfG
MLGQLYMRTDWLEEAETSLWQAVNLHNQAQNILSEGSDWLMLGKLYMCTDRLEEAEISLLQAVDLHEQA